MLKRFTKLIGVVNEEDKDAIKKKGFVRASVILDMGIQSRDVCVRIVHAGGREELFQNPVSVSQLMGKYPGMYVAHPEVFKNPNESFLRPEDKLLPGQKYYMIPSTTAKKLKEKSSIEGLVENKIDISDARITWEVHGDNLGKPFRSAKEFYVSGESCSARPKERIIKKKKAFVPPLPKTSMFPAYRWEPSLTSIPELSP